MPPPPSSSSAGATTGAGGLAVGLVICARLGWTVELPTVTETGDPPLCFSDIMSEIAVSTTSSGTKTCHDTSTLSDTAALAWMSSMPM